MTISDTFENGTSISKVGNVFLAIGLTTSLLPSINIEYEALIEKKHTLNSVFEAPVFSSDISRERTNVINGFLNQFVSQMQEPNAEAEKILEENFWDLF